MTSKAFSLLNKNLNARSSSLFHDLSQVSAMHGRVELELVLTPSFVSFRILLFLGKLVHILCLKKPLVGLLTAHELIRAHLKILRTCLDKFQIRSDFLFTKQLLSADNTCILNMSGNQRILHSTGCKIPYTLLRQLTVFNFLKEFDKTRDFLTVRCLRNFGFR